MVKSLPAPSSDEHACADRGGRGDLAELAGDAHFVSRVRAPTCRSHLVCELVSGARPGYQPQARSPDPLSVLHHLLAYLYTLGQPALAFLARS